MDWGDGTHRGSTPLTTTFNPSSTQVVFVGSAGVGKTCLIRRLFTDKFSPDTQSTIGALRHAVRLHCPDLQPSRPHAR